MSTKTFSYLVETSVPDSYGGNLLAFYQKFLQAQNDRFTNISELNENDKFTLKYNVVSQQKKQVLTVKVNAGNPLEITITPFDETVTMQAIEEARQDVVIGVGVFEEQVKFNTLFFVWREGEAVTPAKASRKEKRSISRLFLEMQILLIVVFTAVSLLVFLVVDGWLAPIVVLAIQFVFVFYSNKIVEKIADWHITKSDPFIHLLKYRLPFEGRKELEKDYPIDKLVSVKKEVYEQAILRKGEVNSENLSQIFGKYGLKYSPNNFSEKKVDVYQLVEKTRQKFHFPMPKIVVSNTLMPNAAASGPSPSRGVVLVTTALLSRLDEDEIVSVLGHEFGHLRGRDPLILFALMSAEFLFRFYVFLPLVPLLFTTFFFFLYFWGVMTLLFFVAKFFEARADLVSAIVIQQPKALARALEKIGFKRLLPERIKSYRVNEWLKLDPHPPLYFRISRLEKIENAATVKHPLIRSAKEVIKAFFDTLRR
jgi:heat shock protein HtpX